MSERPIFKLPSRGNGHEQLAKEYPNTFSLSEGKKIIPIQTTEPGVGINQTEDNVKIFFDHKNPSSLYRGYGQLMANPEAHEVQQKPVLETIGLHIDSSRGAVYKPEFLKKTMLQLALMGYNSATLYTEYFDVDGHPELRQDQLTKKETKEVAKYAKEEFGINMYPSMQTLGHMEKVIRQKDYARFALDRRVLDPNNSDTQAFIRELIANALEPYDTTRINIGCDETPRLPHGTYVEHIARTNEVCKEQRAKPIIWGDILLEKLPPDEAASMPKDIDINYWQYDSEEKEFHTKSLVHLKKYGFNLIVSPGTHSWDRFYPLLPKAEKNIDAVLLAAKEAQVKEAVLTIWGDNGNESALRPNLSALVRFAEHGWDNVDEEGIKRSVAAIGHNSYEDFLLPASLDLSPTQSMESAPKMAKRIIRSEPDAQMTDVFYGPNYYDSLYEQLKEVKDRAHPDNDKLFTFAVALADVLREKVRGNTELQEKYDAMEEAHSQLWLEERKPEGFETIHKKYDSLKTPSTDRWKGDIY